jgi:hypothetical protein
MFKFTPDSDTGGPAAVQVGRGQPPLGGSKNQNVYIFAGSWRSSRRRSSLGIREPKRLHFSPGIKESKRLHFSAVCKNLHGFVQGKRTRHGQPRLRGLGILPRIIKKRRNYRRLSKLTPAGPLGEFTPLFPKTGSGPAACRRPAPDPRLGPSPQGAAGPLFPSLDICSDIRRGLPRPMRPPGRRRFALPVRRPPHSTGRGGVRTVLAAGPRPGSPAVGEEFTTVLSFRTAGILFASHPVPAHEGRAHGLRGRGWATAPPPYPQATFAF